MSETSDGMIARLRSRFGAGGASAARVLLLTPLIACGRTSPEHAGELVLIRIDRCDGHDLQLVPRIRADRSDPPRLGFEVLVLGELPVHGPYRLHYELLDETIGFTSDLPTPQVEAYDRFVGGHSQELAEGEGDLLAPHRRGTVELTPFTPELLTAVRERIELFPPFEQSPFAFPLRIQAELHGIDADGNSICSPPTPLDVAFCTSCPADAC